MLYMFDVDLLIILWTPSLLRLNPWFLPSASTNSTVLLQTTIEDLTKLYLCFWFDTLFFGQVQWAMISVADQVKMFAVCLIYFFKSGFAYFLQLKELFSILTAMKSGVCMFQGFGCCGSSRRRDNYSCKIVISFSRQAMGCCIKNEFCGKSFACYRQTYALISSRLFRDFQDVHTSII